MRKRKIINLGNNIVGSSKSQEYDNTNYNAFEHLWRSIISATTKDRKQSLILMLSAYFDESGTDQKKHKLLTLAGYLSTVERWEKFDVEWQALLNSEGLKYSHAVDMAHFRCQFEREKGWNETRRRSFEERAHKIIKDNIMKAFDVSLFWEDYLLLIPFFKGEAKDVPPAYACLVNMMLLMVGKWTRENKRFEPIHYVFERGVDAQGWVSETYANASTDIEAGGAFHFASLSFAEGKKGINGIPPLTQLQAADMHAYEIHKNREDKYSGRLQKVGKVRGSLANLRAGDTYLYEIDRRLLFNLLKEIEKENAK